MDSQPWTPTFDDFVTHVFVGRGDVPDRDKKFDTDQRLNRFRHDPVLCAEYLIRLSEDASTLLASRSAEEIEEGFGYIESKLMETGLRGKVPRPTQQRLIRSILPLVRDYFLPRFPDGCWQQTSLLEFSAFTRAATSPWFAHLRPIVLEVLQDILRLDQVAANGDALGALCRIRPYAPDEVDRLVQNAVQSLPAKDERAAAYRCELLQPMRESPHMEFDDWLEYVFRHPEPQGPDRTAWYHSDDSEGKSLDWWEPEPVSVAHHLVRLFESPSILLGRYTDEQIDQGFWFVLTGGSHDAHCAAALDDRVPPDLQERWIRAIHAVFRDLFSARCAVYFGHDSRSSSEPARPLNSSCYMWWDLGMFELYGLADSIWHPHLREPICDVLESTLHLTHPACQEGALHGLGHAHEHAPDRVRQIIQRNESRICPALTRYAVAAMRGHVQ